MESALNNGWRGLRGGSSLAWLLAQTRGRRNSRDLPVLTIRQILAWADAHYRRTREYPHEDSGRVTEASGESWSAIANALRVGGRGLPGGATLAQRLHSERGVRNPQALPRLTMRQIRSWARAYRQRTGEWPQIKSGPVAEAPSESWKAIDTALRAGVRGLRGGSSLFRLFHGTR